jgi:hypothetical protein
VVRPSRLRQTDGRVARVFTAELGGAGDGAMAEDLGKLKHAPTLPS